jgi:hypothetical protein
MLTGGALALFVATAFAHTRDAADLTAANAALLEKYFADVNTRDLDALKEVISENYIQHGPGQGHGLAGMQAAFRRDFSNVSGFPLDGRGQCHHQR